VTTPPAPPRVPAELAAAVVDPHAYAQRERVDAALARLRADLPLGLAEIEGSDPFWVVTRHADIKEIERQADIFHNGASLWTSNTNRPQIAISANSGVTTTFNNSAVIPSLDYCTFSILQIGSTVAGSDLLFQCRYQA
jgi:cytochrome P450